MLDLADLPSVFDGLDEGVCVLDGLNYVSYINPAGARILGVEPAAAAGEPACETVCARLFKAGFQDCRAGCPLLDVNSTTQSVTLEGLFVGHGQASARGLRVRCFRLPGPDGPDGGPRLMLLQDVSQALDRAREREDWLGLAAEELRSPLAGLRCLLEVMAGDPAASPRLRHWVELAAEDLLRLRRLVDLFVDLARFGAGQGDVRLAPVDAGTLLRRCLAKAEAYEPGRPLVLIDMPHGLSVLADPDLLARVLEILLSNALRLTPARSKIEIVGAPAPGGGVRLSIADSGPGIAPEDLALLFERAGQLRMRLEGRSPGGGLGLIFCREALSAMGGSIAAFSKDGGGATFVLELPAP